MMTQTRISIAAKLSTALLWSSLAVLGTTACSTPEERRDEEVILDLVAQLDEAEVLRQTGRIDLGTPEARGHLSGDWSWNEKDGSGTSFVWGGPWTSEVGFYRAAAGPSTLRWRCLPYRQNDGHVDGMAIRLDGETLGRIDLADGWRQYELEIPADRLEAGIHRLEFDYEWSAGNEPLGEGPGQRRVAVAWDWIEVSQEASELAAAVATEDRLLLPAGSRVDFFLEAPADADLVIDSIYQTGETPGVLSISTLLDGSSPQSLLEFGGLYHGQPLTGREGRYRSLPLKEVANRWSLAAGAGLVRLRLEATGTFELSRPRVVSASSAASRVAPPPEAPPRRGPADRSHPPLVLLYVIDTLRADHLDGSQASRESRPGLAALLQEGVLFEDVLAQSSWTKPTVASILTGQPPWTHGAQNANDILGADLAGLPDRLRRLGYRTAAFSANGYVSPVFGFDQGFDHFYLTPEFDTQSDRLHAEVLRWLDAQSDERHFLFVQAIDPHAPYAPAEPFRSRYALEGIDLEVGSVEFLRQLAKSGREPDLAEIETLRTLYGAEVAALDHQFAALMAELKNRGLYDSALIVVVSDHGEEFYEHGSWTHGLTLHREVVQVPMVIRFPLGWAGGSRITDPVQQIDLLPTLLDYLEDETSAVGRPGSSLLCAVEGAMAATPLGCGTARARALFSNLHYHQNHWASVVLDGWKLIQPATERLGGEVQLYNLRRDAAERENVAADHPVRVGYLASLIRREMRARTVPVPPPQVELDADTAARLNALGYLD